MATTTGAPVRPLGSAGTTGLTGNTGLAGSTGHGEAQKHSEGQVAAGIEYYTAQFPSDWFLWAAGASILTSLTLQLLGAREDAKFVGQWAPTFLILGVYNKIVKVAGTDRVRPQS